MNSYLKLYFNTSDRDIYTLKINNCKEDITSEILTNAMNELITINPFDDVELSSIDRAELVEQIVTNYSF